MSEALSLGMSLHKELAVKKPQPQVGKPVEQSIAASQGLRESGIEWFENEKSEVSLSRGLSDSNALNFSSTTDTAARVARSGITSQEMLVELKNKFKKMFVANYSNIFSHNRLLAKVSEWMVGNVMERLALMGMSLEELDGLKAQVRQDLISQNQTAMAQVVYDETMLEIVG